MLEFLAEGLQVLVMVLALALQRRHVLVVLGDELAKALLATSLLLRMARMARQVPGSSSLTRRAPASHLEVLEAPLLLLPRLGRRIYIRDLRQ